MKEVIADNNRIIRVYDDVFDFAYKQDIYAFVTKSLFQIGWADGSLIEIVIDVEEGHPWRPYNNKSFRVHPSTLFIRTENRREERKL